MNIRALVILYAGGEVSDHTLQQIKYLIHNDFNARGENTICVQLESDEIAQLAAEAASKAVQETNRGVQINIRSNKKQSKLENACALIGANFIVGSTDPIQLVAAYITKKEITDAMITIANATDAQIAQCANANRFGINNASFISTIRQIVKDL